jgi:hypothetical protein
LDLDKAETQPPGRQAWPSGSPLPDASGILARTAERRAVQQADYRAATGDLQELASATAPVSTSRNTSIGATHAQSSHACDVF